MKKNIVFIAVLLVASSSLVKSQIPIIKATSDKADIRDGLHFKKAAFTFTPGIKTNKYFIELPRKDHRVTFYTDVDSIRFDVSYGGVYNFAVLLNNRDTCFTQLVAAPETVTMYKGQHPDTDIPDTIPFSIAKNNKIYIKGTVNGADTMSFLLDLGASTDSKSEDDEVNTTRSKLEICGIHWDSAAIRIKKGSNGKNESGVIDNSLFQDKIVKIDYDNKQIIIYETMPADTGYSRHEMILDGTTPMMQAGIATKDTTLMTWFVVGTGDQRNGFIDEPTASQYNLYKGSNKFLTYDGRVFVKLPELRVANISFTNVAAILAKAGTHKGYPSVLGNGLLKRFNLILDNRNGFIFLKPNSLRSSPFDNTFLNIYGVITAVVIAILFLAVIIVRTIKRTRTRRQYVFHGYNELSYEES